MGKSAGSKAGGGAGGGGKGKSTGGSGQPQQSLKDRVINSPVVTKTNNYTPNPNTDRTYLTLQGFDRSYRGDQETQVYIDNKTGKLHIKRASKGLVSRGLEESLSKIREQFPEAVIS